MAMRLAETMRLKGKVGHGHIINSNGVRDGDTWVNAPTVRLLWPSRRIVGSPSLTIRKILVIRPGGMCAIMAICRESFWRTRFRNSGQSLETHHPAGKI